MNKLVADNLDEVLLSKDEIDEKVKELGKMLAEEYAGKRPLLICVLKGALIFVADLARAMDIPLEVDFMAVSSYGVTTKSSGVVRILKDLETSIEGRHVLIVEDIIDTGLTLKYLIENLKSRKPASIKICTLLDKPSRRRVQLQPDFCGFEIPDKFVIGYGLDFAEIYRNLPFIGVLKPEAYQ
ncbi:MAG: hypoxanthine phosphoribosyltransferase [Eubacteriales bacterium]|jgi:hypoxanthine phosphoribosyltransferase|nr:hypoxanthine phosphoribosyltransferase [Eubacteriales bacterium]